MKHIKELAEQKMIICFRNVHCVEVAGEGLT